MEEDQKTVLSKYYKTIVNTVQHYNVAPGLVSAGILTTEDAERIAAAETNQSRMMRLMNIVINSSKPNVFETFVRTLEEDQEDGHTAKAMRKSLQGVRISRRMTKQDRAVDCPLEPPEVRVEHQRPLGTAHNPVEPDSTVGEGARAFHPAYDRSISAPAGPDPGASHDPHRSGSYPVGRKGPRLSYWVPEHDCELYFVVVSKLDGNGTHGLRLEKNIHIGGLTVTDIAQGTMASLSHLQKLDVIRTVNGENICTKSVQEFEETISRAEKRFILGIVRSNQVITKRHVDLRMKREPGPGYQFTFIWGGEWPRFPGDSDCYITEITAGGLADHLGLKVGDTLVRVNGKSLQRAQFGVVMRVLLPEINDPKGAILTVERTEFE